MTREESYQLVDKRLTPLIRGLSDAELREGERWYHRAEKFCHLTKSATELHNPRVTLTRVAAATAVLSPLQPWGQNRIMVMHLARDRDAKPETFHKWWEKARAILWDRDPDLTSLVTGIKVKPFWYALLGDESAVVVDRWILRLVYPNDRGYPARVRRIQRVIRQRAPEIGIAPRDLQAALWLKVRREG